jgi:hypothetical protein
MVVTNVVLVSNNQSIQAEVNQRQQFINQSIQLSRLNEALVRLLATAAINAKDDKLRNLLAQQGITVTFTPNTAPGTAPQPPSAGTIAPPQAGTGASATSPASAPASDKKSP